MRALLALALAMALTSHAEAMALHPQAIGLHHDLFFDVMFSAFGLIGFAIVGLLAAHVFDRKIELTFRVFFAVLMVAACLPTGTAFAANSDGTEPDPALTPGAVRTTDRAEICGHSTREFRHVTVIEKIAARRAYGIKTPHAGWCAAGDGCEIDHLIPLTVGGGNPPGSIANLWPMRGDGPNNYHVKDRCEAAAGRALCAGKLTVQQAQDMFRTDWIGHCAAFMGGR